MTTRTPLRWKPVSTFRADQVCTLFIPNHLVARRYCRDVTTSEMFLLAKIEELTDEHRGCYAGNRWLAMWAGVNRLAMKRMISRLRAKGLIYSKSIKGRRVMIPSWVKHPLFPERNPTSTWNTSRGRTVCALQPSPDVQEYRRNRLITQEEAYLLCVIEQLCQNDHGYCWASNRCLGAMVRKSRGAVKSAICRLKERGLLKIAWVDDMRRIVPCWLHLSEAVDHELVRDGILPGPGKQRFDEVDQELEKDLVHWAKTVFSRVQEAVTELHPSGFSQGTQEWSEVNILDSLDYLRNLNYLNHKGTDGTSVLGTPQFTLLCLKIDKILNQVGEFLVSKAQRRRFQFLLE